MKRHLILTVILGTIAATSGAAMADQPNPQPEIPSQPNPKLKKPIVIEGESPPKPSKLARKLEIPQVKPPSLEPSQQLPSDRLINRTLRF
jgi:hypothetical protein